MQNYIDSCHNEPEGRVAYPEQRTLHFENVAKITANSDSVIPKEKQNGSEKYFQVITYDKNEANKSIEQNASKRIEQKRKQNN